jgi:dTDP-4-amino-4,6-dideoxygalactose transaminase
MKKITYVTEPFLPPLDEYIPYLEKIWENKRLTNNGPFHKQFEDALCEYLGVKHLALFTSGTLALVTALQALRITGEVITTPYSFVATAHSLLWNNIKPIFIDIDPVTCNLNPNSIEAAITPNTTAILPVHCYGNPCDVTRIQEIADIYGLKIIYDAAHAFGVKYRGESLVQHGDLSVLSFHATKVFNTFEGGAIVCPDAKIKQRIDYLKNFGFANEITVMAPGINGKMSEIQAAFGLLQLDYIEEVIDRRKAIDGLYRKHLTGIKGIKLFSEHEDTQRNYAYFPILVQTDYPMSRDNLYQRLKDHNIYPRRYFYPLITSMPMYRDLQSADQTNLARATQIADEVLCLPMYPDLDHEVISNIANIISDGAGG